MRNYWWAAEKSFEGCELLEPSLRFILESSRLDFDSRNLMYIGSLEI